MDKKWLSLKDAAKRLSALLKTKHFDTDILQLAIDQKIPLYWYAHNEFAHEIAPFCNIRNKRLTWRFVNISNTGSDVQYINGPHRLEMNFGSSSRIVHELMTEPEIQHRPIEAGLQVIDHEGKLWEILVPFDSETDTNSYLSPGPFTPGYSPFVPFPKRSDFIVMVEDIEFFEYSNGNENKKSVNNEANYIQQVGLLLKIMVKDKKTKEPLKYASGERVLPDGGFKTETDLIQALNTLFGENYPVGHRSLQSKFAKAKRQLKL